MTGKPRTKCPRCGRTASRLITGGAGLIFKGSGFYITDYGKDGKGRRPDKETEKAPEVAPAATDQSPRKPEADKSSRKPEADQSSRKPEADQSSPKPEKAEKPSRKKGSP